MTTLETTPIAATLPEEGAHGAGSAAGARIVIIRPAQKIMLPDLLDLAQYRELLLFLIWRDLAVRYKQTVLGALWAILQPVFTMVVFSVFLGKLAKVPSDGVPYPVFSYCALLPGPTLPTRSRYLAIRW